MPQKQPNIRALLPSFGRRVGRKLSDYHKLLIRDYLPSLQVKAPEEAQTKITLADSFGNDQPIWLEIGFGSGEHLFHLAKKHPEVNFLGAEPYNNGVAKLLQDIQEDIAPPTNIRIIADDVRPVMNALEDEAIARVYLLFPDPWPKTKHHKRRILNHSLLDEIARLLPSKGELRIATDHRDYSTWMLEHLLARKDFTWHVENAHDWTTPFDNWVETRYENKTRAQGREPIYLRFTRI